MKKLFTLMLAMLASTIILFADSGTCGPNLTWDLTDSVLIISGTGAMDNFEIWRAPWYDRYTNNISESPVKTVIINNGVTEIGDYAFFHCEKLQSVTIPASVTRIGNFAFSNCQILPSITLPNSLTTLEDYAFSQCDMLQSIHLPNLLTNIGEHIFAQCTSLTSVTLPQNISRIGSCWFYDCSKLTSIEIPSGVTAIEGGAFSGCSSLTNIVIPDKVDTIGNAAFAYCKKLRSVIIPDKVKSIGYHTFLQCDSLTYVSLGKGIEELNYGAFAYSSNIRKIAINSNAVAAMNLTHLLTGYITECIVGDNITYIGGFNLPAITSLTIGENVSQIADGAFSGYPQLATVTWNAKNCADFTANHVLFNSPSITSFVFGDQVESVPAYLCYNQNKLSAITFPSTTKQIGEYAFAYCSEIPSIDIPVGVTSIGEGAFMGCNKLPSITIPYSVTNIGTNAFFQCDQLTKIDVDAANVNYCSVGGILFDKGQTRLIQHPAQKSGTYVVPNSVTKIENNAFYNSIGITAVTIPNSVAELGDYTFYGCTALKSVTLSNQLTALGNSVFANCSALLSVSVPNNVLSIGTASFSNCSRLETITLGTELETIGSNAFANCKHVVDIYSYAYATPVITSSTFSGVSRNAYVWVPEDMVRRYQIDELWNEFQILPIGAVSTTTDGSVLIQPSDNNASITWPTAENAAMYSLTITKEGQTICTLCFNAQGILTNIAFAPSINGKAHVSAALLTEQGYQFTVTGLDPGTLYAYQIDVTDNQNRTIASYTGTFLTTGSSEAIDNIDVVDKSGKFIKDGTLYIRQGDALYNVNGRRIK